MNKKIKEVLDLIKKLSPNKIENTIIEQSRKLNIEKK